jgi:hypothetical protein
MAAASHASGVIAVGTNSHYIEGTTTYDEVHALPTDSVESSLTFRALPHSNQLIQADLRQHSVIREGLDQPVVKLLFNNTQRPFPEVTGGSAGTPCSSRGHHPLHENHCHDNYHNEQKEFHASGCQVCGEEGNGMHGFEKSVKFYRQHLGSLIPIGLVAWSGENQKGRAYVSLNGAGCSLIRDW